MNAPRHIWRGMGMGVLRRIWLARDAARGVVEMSMMEDGRTDRDLPGAGADLQILHCEAGPRLVIGALRHSRPHAPRQ